MSPLSRRFAFKAGPHLSVVKVGLLRHFSGANVGQQPEFFKFSIGDDKIKRWTRAEKRNNTRAILEGHNSARSDE